MTGTAISLRMILKVELVWVSRVSCQRDTLGKTHTIPEATLVPNDGSVSQCMWLACCHVIQT